MTSTSSSMSNPSSGRKIIREVCEGCTKQIYIGQFTIICENCDMITHKNCTDIKKFDFFRGKWYCQQCISNNEIIRYNPFLDIINTYDPENPDDHDNNNALIETSTKISEILENCNAYNFNQFEYMLKNSNLNRSEF